MGFSDIVYLLFMFLICVKSQKNDTVSPLNEVPSSGYNIIGRNDIRGNDFNVAIENLKYHGMSKDAFPSELQSNSARDVVNMAGTGKVRPTDKLQTMLDMNDITAMETLIKEPTVPNLFSRAFNKKSANTFDKILDLGPNSGQVSGKSTNQTKNTIVAQPTPKFSGKPTPLIIPIDINGSGNKVPINPNRPNMVLIETQNSIINTRKESRLQQNSLSLSPNQKAHKRTRVGGEEPPRNPQMEESLLLNNFPNTLSPQEPKPQTDIINARTFGLSMRNTNMAQLANGLLRNPRLTPKPRVEEDERLNNKMGKPIRGIIVNQNDRAQRKERNADTFGEAEHMHGHSHDHSHGFHDHFNPAMESITGLGESKSLFDMKSPAELLTPEMMNALRTGDHSLMSDNPTLPWDQPMTSQNGMAYFEDGQSMPAQNGLTSFGDAPSMSAQNGMANFVDALSMPPKPNFVTGVEALNTQTKNSGDKEIQKLISNVVSSVDSSSNAGIPIPRQIANQQRDISGGSETNQPGAQQNLKEPFPNEPNGFRQNNALTSSNGEIGKPQVAGGASTGILPPPGNAIRNGISASRGQNVQDQRQAGPFTQTSVQTGQNPRPPAIQNSQPTRIFVNNRNQIPRPWVRRRNQQINIRRGNMQNQFITRNQVVQPQNRQGFLNVNNNPIQSSFSRPRPTGNQQNFQVLRQNHGQGRLLSNNPNLAILPDSNGVVNVNTANVLTNGRNVNPNLANIPNNNRNLNPNLATFPIINRNVNPNLANMPINNRNVNPNLANMPINNRNVNPNLATFPQNARNPMQRTQQARAIQNRSRSSQSNAVFRSNNQELNLINANGSIQRPLVQNRIPNATNMRQNTGNLMGGSTIVPLFVYPVGFGNLTGGRAAISAQIASLLSQVLSQGGRQRMQPFRRISGQNLDGLLQNGSRNTPLLSGQFSNSPQAWARLGLSIEQINSLQAILSTFQSGLSLTPVQNRRLLAGLQNLLRNRMQMNRVQTVRVPQRPPEPQNVRQQFRRQLNQVQPSVAVTGQQQMQRNGALSQRQLLFQQARRQLMQNQRQLPQRQRLNQQVSLPMQSTGQFFQNQGQQFNQQRVFSNQQDNQFNNIQQQQQQLLLQQQQNARSNNNVFR